MVDNNVKVTLRAEVSHPDDRFGETTTFVTRIVTVNETDARLLVKALEAAISEAGADVGAMVAQVHPDRRDLADAMDTATSGAGNPALGEWYPGVEQDLP